MSRVQLALNVDDLDRAIDFYRKLFDTPPAKVRPGYANFAIADPPLKLVLIETPHREPGSINHLGIELDSTELVHQAQERLSRTGLSTVTEDHVACCHALQDKIWVDGSGGQHWEIYTVLADVDLPAGASGAAGALGAAGPSADACCADRPDLAAGPGLAGGSGGNCC